MRGVTKVVEYEADLGGRHRDADEDPAGLPKGPTYGVLGGRDFVEVLNVQEHDAGGCERERVVHAGPALPRAPLHGRHELAYWHVRQAQPRCLGATPASTPR